MMRLSKKLVCAGILVAIGAIEPSAQADWPTLRHDPARTAYAPGTAGITEPTRYWQTYMGGTLGPSTHIALDIDGDAVVEVIYLAGGKAIAKHADDLVVWESTPLDFVQIHGAIDLNGDGAQELVVRSLRNVFVLSGSTGNVLWKSPDGEVGQVGGVRIGDLDGDKHPEIIIDDCSCCGIDAVQTPPGGVYHFDAGNIGAPTKVYTPFARVHCGSRGVTLGDFDADGAMDVAWLDPTTATFTSGKTGAVFGVSASLGEQMYATDCTSSNIDDRPGDEIICFQNWFVASNNQGGRRLFAITYDNAAQPAVQSLYNIAPVPKDVGRLVSLGNSVTDLDGDGTKEITVSWFDGSSWSTQIYDAKTGTSLADIPEQVENIVDIDGDKKPEIITTTGAGRIARSFQRGGSPALIVKAPFPSNFRTLLQHDFAQAAVGALVGKPLEIDLVGDGNVIPVFLSATSNPQYVAARVETGTLKTLASFNIPEGITIRSNQVYANLNRPYQQLVLARSDGFLMFLDSNFEPTNGGTFGPPEFPEHLPGMRVGGFIATPIAPRLSGDSDAIVATSSRGALVNLDASAAWMSAPPKVAWELGYACSPTKATTIDDGKPGLVCTNNATLTALRADGSKIWSQNLGGEGYLNDPLTGDVNGDGISDVFASHSTTGSTLNLQVYNGKDGAPIWPQNFTEPMQWGLCQPFSVADYNGDNVPDMFVVSNTLRILHGGTGTTIASNPTFFGYFTPTILDIDGDGSTEVTMSRGFYPARTFKNDLNTTMWTGDDDRPYQHGARAACNGGRSVWVQPSTQFQGMVRFVNMNGAEVGNKTTQFLAGGSVFATAADATAANKYMGALGDVAVKEDLLGTGDHPSALIGSSDGFLYALNPCTGELDWAYDLKFAVGNPIFADPTGAGVDQILVPAADGYIHALQQRVLAAPTNVNDNAVDGAKVDVGPDLDTVETVNAVGASWDAVAGADGYQVAVLTEGGTFVSQPDWVSVGNVTSAQVQNITLGVGKKYVFAVRAVSKTQGSSIEKKSDGVIVQVPSSLPDGGFVEEDAGADAGVGAPDAGDATPPGNEVSADCGCNAVGSGGTTAGIGGIFGVALAMARRRRMRAKRPH